MGEWLGTGWFAIGRDDDDAGAAGRGDWFPVGPKTFANEGDDTS